MYVQIVDFEVQGLSRAEYEAFCEEAVPLIAQVPGVLGKLFLADAESSRCGAVYTFTDRDAAEAYLEGELFQHGIANNPAIVNLRTRGSDLLERPTRALDDALTATAHAH